MTDKQESMSFVSILKRLLPFAKQYRKHVVASLVLTTCGAVLAQIDPLVLNHLVNQVSELSDQGETFSGSLSILLTSALILLAKSLFMLVVDFGQGYLGETVKVKIGVDLSNAAYSHTMSLGVPFFDLEENSTGRLIQRIDRGVEGLSKVTKNLLIDILPQFSRAVLSLVVMYSVNFWVGLTATVIVPIYFLLSYEQAKRQEGVRIGIHDLKEVRTGAMSIALFSIRVIKSFVRERFEIDKLWELNTSLSDKEIRHHVANRLFDAMKSTLGELGSVAIVILTSYLILEGQMAVGAILLHLMLYRNVTAPIRELHRIYDEHNEAVAFSYGYFSLLDTPTKDRITSLQSDLAETDKLCGDIQVEHLDFSYVPGRRVLHDVNLVLRQGKTTALVGLSGAGKTTLASLLVRFHDPENGQIRVGEKPLNLFSIDAVRRQIGMVLQENHIFEGTIAENIRYGSLQATMTEVQRAAQQAQIHEFVCKLPDGYDSSAHRLSGGQKQRVALARVFLKNPPILILDEPTASLDAITTERIKGAINKMRQKRTVLIISHNISQIVDADWIYVVKEGIIIEEGTHESLYAKGGHYAEIIDSNIENMNLKKLLIGVNAQD